VAGLGKLPGVLATLLSPDRTPYGTLPIAKVGRRLRGGISRSNRLTFDTGWRGGSTNVMETRPARINSMSW
jgi:hypothetical protein